MEACFSGEASSTHGCLKYGMLRSSLPYNCLVFFLSFWALTLAFRAVWNELYELSEL